MDKANIKIGILGATGYVGAQLVELFLSHPNTELVVLGSKNHAGEKISAIYPTFLGGCDLILKDLALENYIDQVDFVISALPHQVGGKLIQQLLMHNIKVIDHSADFRFKSQTLYELTYKLDHPCPELISSAVYGLPELYKKEIQNSKLIANPGCYPTASILGLAPALQTNIISSDNLILHGVSGLSGAGRQAQVAFSFCEAADNYKPYNVTFHRHIAEIEQELSILAKQTVHITFTPHLIPTARGMMLSMYGDLTPEFKDLSTSDLLKIYQNFYQDCPFVQILPLDQFPQTKDLLHTNNIHIGLAIDSRTQKIKIESAIDNLGKGASFQAIQAFNLMFGLAETTGL